MNCWLSDVCYSVPATTLSNEEICRDITGWTAERIKEKLGIVNRHVLGPDETPSDIAVSAAENLFAQNTALRNKIDYLIFCTQSPDYMLPTTAGIIHERLGLAASCGAVDINQGCSGYIHGLALSKGLVESNVASNVLLLTGDAYSKHVGREDPGVRTVFGDAATASLISIRESDSPGMSHFVFGNDGSKAMQLCLRNSGMRKTESAEADKLYMDGPAVLNLTLSAVPRLMEDILNKACIEKEDLDFFVLHQANAFILQQLQRKLGISSKKYVVDFAEFGNTVSSTIPIALSRGVASGRLSAGQKGMLLGFGVGFSWAGCLLQL